MQPDVSAVPAVEYNLATRVAVGDALTRTAAMFGGRTALIDGGGTGQDQDTRQVTRQSVTYAQLDARSNAIARSLLAGGAPAGGRLEGGLRRQEPVAMLMRNSWRMMATYFAAAKAALVALPVNIALSPADIAWILADSAARTVVVDDVALPLLEAFLPDAPGDLRIIAVASGGSALPWEVAGHTVEDWDALATQTSDAPLEVLVEDRDTVQCLYTSGTTSNPKGVLTSHVSVLVGGMTNAMQIGHQWGEDPSTLLDVLPLFHTTALNTLVLPVLFTGGTVVVHAGFDPAAVLADIQRHRVTHFMGLPMMYRALIAVRGDAGPVGGLRSAVYAMAPMPSDLLDQVADLFPGAAVILGSGQTEVVPATVLQWPAHQHTKPDSWGPAVPTVDTAVLGPDSAPLPAGETGEIAYRGPHVMSGYWNNPGANAQSFAGGWFHSGDVGHLDEDHVVWFTDRLKDIIKTGGENVSSVRVEAVLAAAPGVAEVSVIGVPDDHWGEAVCAVVVPADPSAAAGLADAVTRHAAAHLARFEIPKQVLVVDELPKTATGKIRKHLVRRSTRGTASDQT